MTKEDDKKMIRDINECARVIYQSLQMVDEATSEVLRTECERVGFDSTTYNQAMTRLDRQRNYLTEAHTVSGPKWRIQKRMLRKYGYSLPPFGPPRSR